MKLFLALAFTLPLTGCVPVIADYYYISLAVAEGVEVTATGVADYHKMVFHEPMPTRYLLKRDSYVLEFEVDKNAFQPTVRVTARSLEGDDLRILGVKTHPCGGWLPIHSKTRGNVHSFYWATLARKGCLPNSISDDASHSIVFSVEDAGAEVLGEERIPIAIVRNGSVIVYDAI